MTKIPLVAGMDEAGRGPCFGPIVMGLAIMPQDQVEKLAELGVTDSKLLSEEKRVTMAPLLEKCLTHFDLSVVSAAELDDMMSQRSLNEIEAMEGAKLLNACPQKPDIVIVDSPDGYAANFAERLKKYLSFKPIIIAEHKADLNHLIVGAASVLAKVRRDHEIELLRREHGEIGSGYSHDVITRKFLTDYVQSHKVLPPFCRKAWATSQNEMNKLYQQKLF